MFVTKKTYFSKYKLKYLNGLVKTKIFKTGNNDNKHKICTLKLELDFNHINSFPPPSKKKLKIISNVFVISKTKV